MKFSHFLLAAGLCSFSAASAQTTPTQTAPGTGSAAPSAVPSGTAPTTTSSPRGAVSSGEVFTTGAPDANKQPTKHKKEKGSMSNGKMKTKM